MRRVKVSVIMATYNHAPFVADAIQSVLDQDFDDFEFLISDDGSSDETRDVVRTFSDPRIVFEENVINRGACTVTNELIKRATGQYIALVNSDDVWVQGKLKYQVNLLDSKKSIGACFSHVDFIDGKGISIEKNNLVFGDAFSQENRSRGMWLRYFFDRGNCICHPSMLIRRSCYSDVGLLRNSLRQLPDYEMWIRLVKKHNIFIIDKKLVKFRIIHGKNASSQTSENSVRTMNEHYLIADRFFEHVDRALLKDGFSDLLVCKDIPTPEHLEIEKSLLYLSPNSDPDLEKCYSLIGLRKLYTLFDSVPGVLYDEYGLNEHWFHKKMGEIYTIRLPFDALHQIDATLREALPAKLWSLIAPMRKLGKKFNF